MTTLSRHRHRHFMLTSSLLSCSSCSLFSPCCLPPFILTAGSGQSRMGIWYIKFHDAKWMIICDYTRLQILEPKDTHMAASCMELNEGGSWRGRERIWTTTKPIQICGPLRPGSRPFLLSLALCAAFRSTPDSGIHTTYTYVHTYVFMYIRSWCSWLCVNGQRTRFYIERQIGC